MGKDFRKMLRKWNLILFFVTLMMAGVLVSQSFGDEPRKLKWGLSVAGGFNAHQKPNLMMFAFLPRIGLALHENWDLEFEGNISYYGVQDDKNLYFLGVNTNLLFTPIQWQRGTLFFLGGVGLGYNNSNGKIHDIGDSNLAGLLQAGGGVRIKVTEGWWLGGEYRYQHISDPFNHDPGLNTHTFILGVSF